VQAQNIAVGIIIGFIVGAGTLYVAQDYVLPTENTVQENTVDEKNMDEYKQWATGEFEKYQEYSEQLKTQIDDLVSENQKLQNDLYNAKQPSMEDLLEKARLKVEAESLKGDLERLFEAFEEKTYEPKVTMSDQTVSWEFYDAQNNFYSWSLPIESYEGYIRAPEPTNTVRLQMDSGKIVTVRDHTQFVRQSFTEVIDQVYDNAGSDAGFIAQVWYIVSQLTTFSYDIGEDPRWAVETFTRGGGDCEDLAILIADMIRSSKHTKNWDVELIYFDSNNPTRAKDVNHVAVVVDYGDGALIIEPTAKTSNDAFYWNEEGISGWRYNV